MEIPIRIFKYSRIETTDLSLTQNSGGNSIARIFQSKPYLVKHLF
jgi:hypothetical protein